MAISYPVSLPDTNFSAALWSGGNVVGVTESPFTKSRQVQQWAEFWAGEIEPIPKVRADVDAWIAFVLSLYGQYGTLLLGDPLRTTPRGAGGSLQVDGASQTGYTLNIKNGALSTLVLKAGDHFQLGTGSTSRLYVNLTDLTTDGAGKATANIWPALRESPSNSAALTLSSPKGLFRLASNDSSWSVDASKFHLMRIPVMEAL